MYAYINIKIFVDISWRSGLTALHSACLFGQLSSLKMLMSLKADPEVGLDTSKRCRAGDGRGVVASQRLPPAGQRGCGAHRLQPVAPELHHGGGARAGDGIHLKKSQNIEIS